MNTALAIIYGLLAVLAGAVYVFNRAAHKRRLKLLGKVDICWHPRLSLALPINAWGIGFLAACLAFAVFLILSRPRASDGYHLSVLLLIILAFGPRFRRALGSEGMLDGMTFIPWHCTRNRRVVKDKGRYYLEVEVDDRSDDGVTRLRRFRLPKKALRGLMHEA